MVGILNSSDNTVYSTIMFSTNDNFITPSDSKKQGLDLIMITIDGEGAAVLRAIISACDPSLSYSEAGELGGDLLDGILDEIKGGKSGSIAGGREERNGIQYNLVYSATDALPSFMMSVLPISEEGAKAEEGSTVVTYTDVKIITRVQEELNKRGYDCGAPDGVIGAQTTAALNKYQEDNGLAVTAEITSQLLDSLDIEVVDGKLAPTTGEKNALQRAKSYLRSSAFSYEGLIHQLEYEKFSHEEAVYGADNCGADWFEQAAKKAESYLKSSAFSRDGLIHQLEYEKFTHEQAVYGVEQNGY